LTKWRKKEYAKHIIKIASVGMNKEYGIDIKKLKNEDELLLRHIVEANDVNDI
jgi:hypothetical protein